MKPPYDRHNNAVLSPTLKYLATLSFPRSIAGTIEEECDIFSGEAEQTKCEANIAAYTDTGCFTGDSSDPAELAVKIGNGECDQGMQKYIFALFTILINILLMVFTHRMRCKYTVGHPVD